MKSVVRFFTKISFSALFWIFMLLTLAVSMRSLFSSSFFRTHDFTHAARLVEMQRSLMGGEFPVRWSRNFGFGYGMPLFNFYAPLPYYLGQIPLLLGVSPIDVTKLLYVLNGILAFLGMYLLGRELWGRAGGLLAAVAFSFSTYRAVDLFVRGALGEAFALVLLPFALYGVVRITRSMRYGWLITAFSLGAILLSHNLTGMISVGVVSMWWVLLVLIGEGRKKGNIAPIVIGVLTAVGLSAFYIFPAFLQKNLTRVDQTITVGYFDYHNHFLCAKQLLVGKWGYGGSQPSCTDDIGFFFGTAAVIFFVASTLFVFMRGSRKEKKVFSVVLLFLILSSFMTIGRSQFLWDHLSILKYFQFPWRFLTFSHVFFSLAIGALGVYISKNKGYEKVLVIGISLLLVVLSARFYFPEKLIPVYLLGEYYTTSPEWIQIATSKTLSDYLPPSVHDDRLPIPALSRLSVNQGTVTITQDNPTDVRALVRCEDACIVTINIFQFPGWKANVDGKSVEMKTQESGLPVYLLTLDRGEHQVRIFLTNTPLVTESNGISVFTLSMIIGYLLIERRKAKRHHV